MLERMYNEAMTSTDPQAPIYFAKLAILEYCGWIEESMDEIARRAIKRKIRTITFEQIFNDKIIGGTSGFQYKKHFRPMLIQIIGIVGMEELQDHLDRTGNLDVFIKELEDLKKNRNTAAHTWIGVTNTYPAPSLPLKSLNIIFPI